MVIVTEQQFDETVDYIDIAGIKFVRHTKVPEIMCAFVRKLIEEGKLKPVDGYEDYFKLGGNVE